MSGQPKDGGPAYPHEADYIRGDKPGDLYKFKVDFHPGMTLRDYFAGQALITMERVINATGEPVELIAGACYEIADAMIAKREKGGAE